MTIKHILIGLFCLTLGFVPTVTALSQFDIHVSPVIWKTPMGDNYNPFDDTDYLQDILFDVSQNTGYTGNYFLTFSKGGSDLFDREAKTVDGKTIHYQLYGTLNSQFFLKDLPELGSLNEVVQGQISTGSPPNQHAIYMRVPSQQMLAPGVYTDTVEMTLYEGEFTNSLSVQSSRKVSIPIRIQVDKVSQFSVGDDDYGDSATVNYGFDYINEGEFLEYDLFVRSNVPYQILAYSENEGFLMHENKQAKTKIDYVYMIDDVAMDLHNVEGIQFTPMFQTDYKVMSHVHKIRMILKKTSHAFRGQYFDPVSFDILPLY
ncbi:spore coat protein U domain-containing protein [bacterium]|jgi:spore coat protein U-like protein|nr:spore coat protein U domain-containing protein [bacterium]